MIKSWHYWTPEGLKMGTWTRKKRLKFKKRWRKQHGGQKFCWFVSEYRYAYKMPEEMHVIFFQRE